MADIKAMGRKALVADADVGVRDTIYKSLVGLGFDEIHEVEDGSDALRALDRHRYDLIVSDVILPNVSGIEFVEVLRSPGQLRFDIKQSRTPVIFVTESKHEWHIQRARELGSRGYVLKPVTEDGLRTRLEKIYTQ